MENTAVFHLKDNVSFPYITTFMHALEMAGYKPTLDTEDCIATEINYLCYVVRW